MAQLNSAFMGGFLSTMHFSAPGAAIVRILSRFVFFQSPDV